VIAKARVLGLRAADARAIADAGRRIVEYLEGGRHRDQEPRKPGAAEDGGMPPDGEADELVRLAHYYEAGPDGRSLGRARGNAARALGLSGVVTSEALIRGLKGRHPIMDVPLLGPRGSSGRSSGPPPGSRPVVRHGAPDETLSIPEAAFVAGVLPRYLRRLAEAQPRTRFDRPTPSNDVDPRVARRLIEALTGRRLTIPIPGSERDYLIADKHGRDWRVRRGELERYMAERIVPETVMGFDVVCAAPKSVSLLWAVGDARVRADIAEAFDSAVDATLAYLEAHGCYGMVDGRNLPGDGLAVVSYVHDTSRATDAHLHTHNLILNAVPVTVRDEHGRPVTDGHGRPRVEWRALDSGALLRHVKTAGYVGAAELRHQLSTRWGITWTTPRAGVAEIAAFPSELLRAFSTRHEQVAEEFATLVEAGHDADGATEVAAQRASRPPKTVLADDQVRAAQAARLADIGWSPERVQGLIAPGPRILLPVTDVDVVELADRLVGPTGLTERQTTFTAREVHQAVGEWACDRLTARGVRAVAEALLADPRVVMCGVGERARTRQDPDPTFSTEDLLAAEDNLQVLYLQGRVDHGAPPSAAITGAPVDTAIAEVNAQLATERDDPAAHLSDEQADLVRDVLASGDLIRCALGPAGTGKTEAMRAAVAAWQAAGFTVIGCANGGAQTEQLAGRLGIDAQVVRAWLTRLDTAEHPATVWPPNTIMVVDEATQVSTRDAERLARWATRTDSVLAFIGDPAQLGSVGAGGWFRHLVYAHGAPTLTTVYRQAGADMAGVRAALAGLRSEMPARIRTAMDRLAADGRVGVYTDPDALFAHVVDDWYADRRERLTATGPHVPKPSFMLAAHHREIDTLNTLARRRLIADGTINGPDLEVGERRFAAGDEVVTLTQAGHTLVPSGASKDGYIRTGTVGTVRAVRINPAVPDTQSVEVDFAGRGTVHVDWAYLTHQFGDGRSGALAHAYAVTADRSQGSTMHAARAVGTDTTSRAAFYVMVSRGRRDLAAYLATNRDLTLHADDEQWLPVIGHPGGPLQAVAEHLERSRTERLATDLDPHAAAAHALRRGRTLAELAAIRHTAQLHGSLPGQVSFVAARRAELAEEAAIGATAITRPPPELVARIGTRPERATQRRAWDEAVRAVAAYRARTQVIPAPDDETAAASALGPRPMTERSPWTMQRAHAERIATRWTDQLDPAHRNRYHAVIEHIPRERAIAGIHALLDAGIPAPEIEAALKEREQRSARAGAPVLDHRVRALLGTHHLDPAGHRLPAPHTPAEEWDHAAALLATAEAHHLSRRPVASLAAERQELTQVLAGNVDSHTADRLTADLAAARAALDDVTDRRDLARRDLDTETSRRRPNRARRAELRLAADTWERRAAEHADTVDALTQRLRAAAGDTGAHRALRDHHHAITLALDLLVDDAMRTAVSRPADYLVGFLGTRPPDPDRAEEWDRRARQVESWRHHTLGLPYGQPAAGPDAPPSEQALGRTPADPTAAIGRRQLVEHSQATLDLGAGM
jgi:conjugative relaxase-like TrwC/TraI family protein